MLERECIGRHFVFADDKNVARADLVSDLERLFQAKGFVAEIDNQIFGVAAQFTRQAGGFAIHPSAKGSHVNVGLADDGLRRRGERKHQPIFSDSKANPWSWWSAQRLR